MLIDIHVHTIDPQPVTRPDGTFYPSPRQLIDMMDEAGIDIAVVMTTVSPEYRYCIVTPDMVLDICRERPDRLVPFANIDPRWLLNDVTSDFGPMLRYFIDAGAKGIGEYIPNIPFDDPLNINVYKQVEEAGLPLTFHIGPRIGGCYGLYDELGLPRMERALKACPDLKFFGHSQPFWAEIGTDVTDETRSGYPTGKVTPGRLVELMREYPNLCGDLSAGSGFNAISRDPEFGYRFMEEFQDRLLFGTDIAGVPQDLPIVPFFRQIEEQNLIGQEAYDKITWRNADRILGLGLATRDS